MPATLADVAALPTVDVPGVELLRVGRWNGNDYTREILARLAANWADLKGMWDVPLTLGHDGESALGDGEPAIGWVDQVHLDGDTLVGDYRKVPQKLAALMKSGGYPKRSCTVLVDAEIDGKRRDYVLQNVALLGAHQPAVDGLADVAALYNRRRLAATGGTTLTLVYGSIAELPDNIKKLPESQQRQWMGVWNSAYKAAKDKGMTDDSAEAAAFKQANAVALARLLPEARAGYEAWKAAHPQQYQLVSGPPMSDIQSAVEKALQAAYPPAQGEAEDEPGADGPSQNILDWFVAGDTKSVIVSDQDVDNLFEIPFEYDAAQDTATLQNPIPVKGTYTPSTSGQESGEPAGEEPDETGSGEPPPPPPPAAGAAEQMARQQPADTAVEELISQAKGELEAWLTKVNAIAAGKPGVSEFRGLLEAAKRSMDRIKVAKPADAPKPAAAQNSRQEEPDVKLSQLAKIYGLPETATEDEVMRAAEGSVVAAPMITRLAKQMDDMRREQAETKIDAMLTEAVTQGRLKRWAKPGEDGELYTQIRTLARSNMATAQSIVASLPKLVDTEEHGASGNQGDPPGFAITPGVARELRRLGRDPATISTETLEQRWERERHEKQLARSKKFGIPAPAAPPSVG